MFRWWSMWASVVAGSRPTVRPSAVGFGMVPTRCRIGHRSNLVSAHGWWKTLLFANQRRQKSHERMNRESRGGATSVPIPMAAGPGGPEVGRRLENVSNSNHSAFR
jgi:hypothetical protein